LPVSCGQGAAIEARDSGVGNTPLLLASREGRLEIAELLLDKGANIEAKNEDGGTPLLIASQGGRLEIVALLLQSGANVEAQGNVTGNTSLLHASSNGHLEIVALLVAKGAKIDTRNKEGKTAEDVATTSEIKAVLQAARNDKRDSSLISDLLQKFEIESTPTPTQCTGIVQTSSSDGERCTNPFQNGSVSCIQCHGVIKTGPNAGQRCLTKSDKIHRIFDALYFCGKHSPNPKRSQPTPAQRAAQQKLVEARIQMEEALKQGSKEWGRSKIMIVGEGRAGKTAVANSIVGTPFTETSSTLGINQLACSVSHLARGEGKWLMMDKIARKEYEMAVAQLMANKATHHQMGSDDIQASLGAKRHVKQSGETGLRPLASQPGEESTPSAETASQSPEISARRPSESMGKPAEKSPRKQNSIESNQLFSKAAAAPAPVAASAAPAAPATVSLEMDESHLMMCYSDTAQTDTSLVIAVFDFGGQEVFNVIHHLFLTQYGVYVLCFNCEWLQEGAPPADTERCLGFLRSWLNSIVLHTYDAENKTCAPVVLVGTHCDIVSSPEEHEKISFKLNEELGKSLAWTFCIKNVEGKGSRGRANLAFFPVDNHQGRDDPVVQYMMRRIEEEMEAATYTHKQVPLNWFKTMDAIKETGKSFLQLSEVTSIAAACGVKQDHVELLLRLLHEMGHLLWLEEDLGLREVIILDAIDYLVKPATLVVCNHKGTPGVDLTQHELGEHVNV